MSDMFLNFVFFFWAAGFYFWSFIFVDYVPKCFILLGKLKGET